MVKIQSTFIGYSGAPCTLFSLYEDESGVLVISVQADYKTERRDDCVIITNDSRIDRDVLFNDDSIGKAIDSYYLLKAGMSFDGSSSRLTFSDSGRASMANPESSIEKDGIDMNGPRYRISEGVTCGQMAALATCMYVMNFDTIEQSVKMADDLLKIMNGEVYSI